MKEGVTCKKCGGTHHYWLSSKWQFQCSECGFRTTLRSGTVMENSRLPYRVWFLIIYLMTSTKKGLSACELQRQLGHKRYATVWSIMHRLRAASTPDQPFLPIKVPPTLTLRTWLRPMFGRLPKMWLKAKAFAGFICH